MKRLIPIALLLSLLISLPVLAEDQSATVFSSGEDGSFELTITVSQPNEAKGAFVFVAKLRDQAGNVVISEPTITVAGGESAAVETTSGEFVFSLTVSTEPETKRAVAAGKLSRGGKVVFEPKVVLATP